MQCHLTISQYARVHLCEGEHSRHFHRVPARALRSFQWSIRAELHFPTAHGHTPTKTNGGLGDPKWHSMSHSCIKLDCDVSKCWIESISLQTYREKGQNLASQPDVSNGTGQTCQHSVKHLGVSRMISLASRVGTLV